MGALALLAKYPVLPEAREWLRAEGPKLDALLSDFLYAQARDRARQRVADALNRKEETELQVFFSEVEEEMELVSHPLARMLVAAVDEDLLTRRFAVSESKRLSGLLEREPGETAAAVARALDVPFRRRETEDDKTFGLHFADYLTRSPNEKAWKLVRHDVQDGTVWLDKKDFTRLVEEVYKRRLEEEASGRSGEVPAVFREVFRAAIARLKQEAERLSAEYRESGFSEVDQERFPPCMRRILTDMHNHINVPHMGRLAIVTFLNALGMESDHILRFFSSVPDFDPEKSRYQVEHITGKNGATTYTTPRCDTMQTYGVCPLEERDKHCATISHPLSYYRKALWMKERGIAMPGAKDEDPQKVATAESAQDLKAAGAATPVTRPDNKAANPPKQSVNKEATT